MLQIRPRFFGLGFLLTTVPELIWRQESYSSGAESMVTIQLITFSPKLASGLTSLPEPSHSMGLREHYFSKQQLGFLQSIDPLLNAAKMSLELH